MAKPWRTKLLFRYKPLDTGLEARILGNKIINHEFRVIDLSEPWGSPVDPSRWRKYSAKNTVALVWGMFKLESPVFIDFCRNSGIPLIFMERSPLLKNGRLALYFDTGGTTNFSAYWSAGNWFKIMQNPLTPEQLDSLQAYRKSISGISTGVDIQKSGFETADEIKRKLGLPEDKKIVFCPMQVDHDVTITTPESSPWIRNMSQFLGVVAECLDAMPDDYHIVVKEHPRNVIDGALTQFGANSQKISFVREEINANSLCQGCDAVLSINSGMGTEAMVFHKPVISLGKSFYSDKGLNFEARNTDELKEYFSSISELRPPTALQDLYIYHFVFDYTYDLETEDDSARFVNLVKRVVRCV
ncbi:MAG: hypothetical protein HZA20_10090 [Nitrospirae bacterium]|nr:hypothetical protein [Nitrospirota bacterium]